jgi:hypothetical protein
MLGAQTITGKIFINYRRDDSIGTAGRLHDRLAQTFGRKNLFMDVDNIPAGVDFVNQLNSQVGGCDIFLAIIGPNWLNAKDDYGRRRLDNLDDFVLVEIAAALARNIYVIPVLVDGALIPTADELPHSIKPLARRNAVEVRNTQFGRDAEALVEKVSEALKGPRPMIGLWPFLASAAARLMGPSHWRSVAKSAASLLLVGWIGYQMGVPVGAVWTPRTERPNAVSTEKARAADDAEARRKTEEAERQRLAAIREEEERNANAAAEAEAKRKSEESERERLAALRAEEERKAKAAAEAEAKRKSEESERERLATVRAEEERRKQAEAERLLALLPISGAWKITTTPSGPSPICSFIQVGSQLNGFCTGPQASGNVIGTVSGPKVRWRWQRVTYRHGSAAGFDFLGTLKPDNTITGMLTRGETGFSEQFAAKRIYR